MFRKFVFWLHFSLGCLAGLVILTMSLTGILLAFERQINSWADTPEVFQGHTASAPQISLDALLASLKSGGQGTPSQLVLHDKPDAAVEARFGRNKTLYLNRWTAEVIGQPSAATHSFFFSVERIHRSIGLGMQSALGRGITGAANLAFLFMLISGLYLWLPRIFNIASLRNRLLFRRGIQGRAREWNCHHVVGIWTAIPLLFIVASGVIMSYPWASNLLFTLTGSQPPAAGFRGERPEAVNAGGHVAHKDQYATPANFHTLDELVSAVKQQVPEWKSISIDIAQPEAQVQNFSVDKSIGGQPEKSLQLSLNRQTGAIEKIRTFSDNSTGRKLRAWARFMHTGEEFGVTGEVIASLASLGAVILVWTGISMALRRLLANQRVVIETQRDSDVQAQIEFG